MKIPQFSSMPGNARAAAARPPLALAKGAVRLRGVAVLLVLCTIGLALSTGLAFAADHLHSDLTIEPGKQFLLGGSQPGAFKVVAKHKGQVAVEIRERFRDGSTVSKATLRAGQAGVLRFASGSTAVLQNPSTRQANMDLKVTGDTNDLSMKSEAVTATVPEVPHLTATELATALADWHGTLLYMDYRSKKPVELHTAMHAEWAPAGQLLLRFDYEEPNKKHVYGTDTLQLAAEGTVVQWDGMNFAVRSKEWLPEQTLKVLLEGEGRDDDRPATIRKTLLLSTRKMSLKKEVRYAAGADFLLRHQYEFAR